MVIFPKRIVSLGAILIFTILSETAVADLSPHGRPGNLRTLPGISIGVSGGVGDSTTQQSVYVEVKTQHRFMMFAELSQASSEADDVAVNGDLDLEFSGATVGAYYQLPDYRNTHLTVAIRVQDGENSNDAVILSGASRVDLVEESLATEIALLMEHKSWARGYWQPYAGIGFRVTETDTNVDTTGGRDIISDRLSWFLEGSASSADDDPLRISLGLRYGFFHRRESSP